MGVTQPREPDRIKCLECGRWYRALPTHLIRSHEMTDEDYRLKHGLPVGVPLVCLEWSANQAARNAEMGLARNLTANGPPKGYSHRESVRVRRRDEYARLAAIGRDAAAKDKTADRRERLRPYPVTVAQAAERLGCTASAAYNFLSYCTLHGRLRRVGRGLYADA